ncbi:MAG: hypothetical protein V1698_02045 [bacterium]
MKKSGLILKSFLCSIGLVGYIMLVSAILNNAEKWFGSVNKFWGPVAMLLLFVFSALISGMLVLGYPIWLYLEQKKKEAISMLGYNVGWIFVILVVAFVVLGIF